MLTQKLPHKGLSFGQVLASVGWAGWMPDLRELPEVPHSLRRLIKACLSFAPAERPTAKEVRGSLRRIPKNARMKAVRMLVSFVSLCEPVVVRPRKVRGRISSSSPTREWPAGKGRSDS